MWLTCSLSIYLSIYLSISYSLTPCVRESNILSVSVNSVLFLPLTLFSFNYILSLSLSFSFSLSLSLSLSLIHTHTQSLWLPYFHSFTIIGLAVRVFANGPGDPGSIPGRVIPKTQKMVLDASLLNTQHYKVRIKGKVEQSRERVALSPTPWCSSYRKGSLRVTLDFGRQLYLQSLFLSHIHTPSFSISFSFTVIFHFFPSQISPYLSLFSFSLKFV